MFDSNGFSPKTLWHVIRLGRGLISPPVLCFYSIPEWQRVYVTALKILWNGVVR